MVSRILCSSLLTDAEGGGAKPNWGPPAHQCTDPALWWSQVQCCVQDPARTMGGSWSKELHFPMVFREECLKATFGMGATECKTLLWQVGGEVAGWCFSNMDHQPSGSNQSAWLCSAYNYHLPRGSLRFCRTIQRHTLDCWVYSLGKN